MTEFSSVITTKERLLTFITFLKCTKIPVQSYFYSNRIDTIKINDTSERGKMF